MQQADTVFDELELCLVDRPNSRRFTILRKLTDLFLAGAETYSDESIQFFDELMGRLINRIERQALIELSQKLAPVDRAPRGVIGRLSNDDDFAIAQPVLEQSSVLTESDLVQIAKTKSQDHLYAIASRAQISAPVTDVLVERGDSRVAGKVTGNTGARFSRWGLTQAVQRAEHDEAIAVAIVNRADLPDDLLEELVRKATKVVQKRLMVSSTAGNTAKNIPSSENRLGPGRAVGLFAGSWRPNAPEKGLCAVKSPHIAIRRRQKYRRADRHAGDNGRIARRDDYETRSGGIRRGVGRTQQSVRHRVARHAKDDLGADAASCRVQRTDQRAVRYLCRAFARRRTTDAASRANERNPQYREAPRVYPFRPGTCRRVIGKCVFLPVNFGKLLKCARSSSRIGDAIAALNASGESNTTSLPTM